MREVNGRFRVKDLTGQKFGRLTVMELTGKKTKSGNAIWICQCECGNITEADSGSLRVGYKVSCGCFAKDHARSLNISHGGRNERLYLVWMDMRRRCRDEKDENYKNYGGRGIKVCKEWQDYAVFRNWALTHGYDKNAKYSTCTLDRIDVNGNYEPSNCRFVNMKVQCNNKRNNRVIEFNGETMTAVQWARKLGMNDSIVSKRLNAGWSIERALTEPPRVTKRTVSSAKAV